MESACLQWKKQAVKLMLILLAVLLVLLGVLYAAGADRTDRSCVGSFDLKRYMGTWYEIARYEHRFERGLEAVEACYALRADGVVEVVNSGVDFRTGKRRASHGKARTGRLPGQLRVSFFWFFYTDYNVLEVGDDYDWALVGGRTSKYLWILSRTPTLPALTLNRILHHAARRGYSTGRLHYVDQGR